MKGSYQHKLAKQKEASRRRIGKFILLAVGLYIFVVVARLLFGGVVTVTNSSAISLSYWLFDSQGTFPDYFRDRDELIARIKELEADLSVRNSDGKTLDHLVRENMSLRSLLNNTATDRVAASVVSRPPQVSFDALLIDVGERDGVVENAVVYVGKDRAVGVVVEVYAHHSLVKLVSTPGTESTVYVLGSNVYTTAVGIGGGILQVNMPQGIPFQAGDLVVVPTLGSGIYGEVGEVVSVPTEPVQYGFVTIDVPLQGLRYVSVDTSPVQSITYEESEEIINQARLEMLVVNVPDHALVQSTTTPTSTSVIGGVNLASTTDASSTE